MRRSVVGVVLLATLLAPPRIEIRTRGYSYPAFEKVEIPIKMSPHAANRRVRLEIGCLDEDIPFLITEREVDPADRWVTPAFFINAPAACTALIVASLEGTDTLLGIATKEIAFVP